MADDKPRTPEFEPPQACVSRIIKNILPENVQITKDARAAFTRAAGIFIFYLVSYVLHCVYIHIYLYVFILYAYLFVLVFAF